MSKVSLILIIILICSHLITLYISLLIKSKRESQGALEFSLTMFAISIYINGYTFSLLGNNLETLIYALKFQYIGLSFICSFFFLFSLRYGLKKPLGKKIWILNMIVPFIILILAISVDKHDYFYKNISLHWNGYFNVIKYEPGWGYLLNLFYQIGVSIIATILLLISMFKWNKNRKKQIIVLILGALFPIVGGFLTAVNLTPLGMDIQPFLLAITGLFVTFGLFKFDLFEIIPFARKVVVDSIKEGLIVIDLKGKVLDINKEIKNNQLTKDIRIGEYIPNYLRLKKYLNENFELEGKKQEKIKEIEFEDNENYYQIKIYPIFKRENHIDAYALLISNITEKVNLINELEYQAKYDPLTNLYNRRHILGIVEEQMGYALKNSLSLGLILLDIDYFKKINDTYGHYAGDLVLINLSYVLKETIGEGNFVARFGGEEFLIICPNFNEEDLEKLALKIRENIINEEFLYEENFIQVRASFGLYSSKVDQKVSFDQLLQKADKALYYSKENGRDKITSFNKIKKTNQN